MRDDDLGALRRRHRLPFRLVFDTASRSDPMANGQIQVCSRHLLYEVDDLCLDLWLDRAVQAPQATLSGQLSHRVDPLRPLTDIPVFLASGERIVAASASDRQGEFRLEYELRDALTLCLPFGDDGVIELPMT